MHVSQCHLTTWCNYIHATFCSSEEYSAHPVINSGIIALHPKVHGAMTRALSKLADCTGDNYIQCLQPKSVRNTLCCWWLDGYHFWQQSIVATVFKVTKPHQIYTHAPCSRRIQPGVLEYTLASENLQLIVTQGHVCEHCYSMTAQGHAVLRMSPNNATSQFSSTCTLYRFDWPVHCLCFYYSTNNFPTLCNC